MSKPWRGLSEWWMVILTSALIALSSCKPSQQVVERHHIINRDSLVVRTDVVRLPVTYVTKIDRPCRDSILRPFKESFSSNGIDISIEEKDGSIVAEMTSDSIVSTNIEVERRESVKDTEKVVETVTERHIPKWVWYSLALNAGLLIWIFRKPLLKLIFPVI